MCGDGSHPASAGPGRCAEAARALLAARGLPVSLAAVEPGAAGPPADPIAASVGVNRQLARVVRETVAAGRLPLVLAGSCDASLGLLAGVEHSACGVVWLDAHGDFNTPESSVSGFFPGMSLAVVVGDCYREHWALVGDGGPIAAHSTVLVGVRDLSPAAERTRLEASSVRAVPWRDGRPQGDLRDVLDDLATVVNDVYLHVDLDALDPTVAPGIVDDPVPGGLSLEDAERVVRAVLERFRLRAAALTTYVPERDVEERTLAAQLRLIELLAAAGA
jgi:arginase